LWWGYNKYETREIPMEAWVVLRKKAASVLLKLFINGNEKCHSTYTP